MQTLTWELAQAELEKLQPVIDKWLQLTADDIGRYPHNLGNGEMLGQLLANLNWYVMKLGEYQPKYERLKNWTERRYEIEKGLETVRIARDEKKAINWAQSAKYEKVQTFLDTMVTASSMHMRVQNARSSARDTTEAIRSRISQLKGV